MTTIDTHQGTASATERDGRSVFAAIADWATTIDHKKIGRLFIGLGLLELLGAAVLGLVLGIERMTDTATTSFDPDALLQLFQGYRVGLIFAAAAPIAMGLSIAVAPIQVGARTMAFPRVALLGVYLWFGGVFMTFASLIANGGIGGGITDMIDLFLVGNGLMMLGLIAAAISVGTTVMATRAPGLRLGRVPIFAWSAMVFSIGILLAIPVAFGIVIYTFVDHRYGMGDAFAGSEGIEAWLGWVWSTPMVLVFTIPTLGVFAELIPVTFRSPGVVPGIRRASIATIGVVALAAMTQQRMFSLTFGGDQGFGDFIVDLIPYLAFVGLPLAGLGGSGLVSLATIRDGIRNGKPNINAPFSFGLFSLLLILAAFVGNALLSITNLELAGTTFEEGIVILAVYGAAIGAMGGLVFWAPKLSGKVISAAKVLGVALLLTIGAVLAGGSMLIAGALGQVGGVPNNDAAVAAMLDLPAGGQLWNLLSLVGHGVFALGVVVFALAVLQTKVPTDRAVEDNPYGGLTIEWTTSSPAPEHNFEHVPAVSSATPAYRPNVSTVVEGSDS